MGLFGPDEDPNAMPSYRDPNRICYLYDKPLVVSTTRKYKKSIPELVKRIRVIEKQLAIVVPHAGGKHGIKCPMCDLTVRSENAFLFEKFSWPQFLTHYMKYHGVEVPDVFIKAINETYEGLT